MTVVLVIFKPDGERRSFSIARDVTVIGRHKSCHLRISRAEVSRKHCRLVREENTIRIEDMGSSNGTYYNDERVHDATLAPGDRIRVGPVTFIVQIDGRPSEEELNPVGPPPPAAEPYEPTSDFAIAADQADSADDEDKLVDFDLNKPPDTMPQ
jgi:pSer/pThr/pTyr-binding forkhead associated (FHA) protein